MISAFLFWIIKDCLFLLGYLSGRQSFLKPLSPEEERAALLRMREGDETPPNAGGAQHAPDRAYSAKVQGTRLYL